MMASSLNARGMGAEWLALTCSTAFRNDAWGGANIAANKSQSTNKMPANGAALIRQ
jgi:hypothetical protein